MSTSSSGFYNYLAAIQNQEFSLESQASELLANQKSFIKEALRMFVYAHSEPRTTGMAPQVIDLLKDYKEYHNNVLKNAIESPEIFNSAQHKFYHKIHTAEIRDEDKLGFEFLLGITRFELTARVDVEFVDHLRSRGLEGFENIDTKKIRDDINAPDKDIAQRLVDTGKHAREIIDALTGQFLGKKGKEGYWSNAQEFFDSNSNINALCSDLVSMQYIPQRQEILALAQVLHWNGFGGMGEIFSEFLSDMKAPEDIKAATVLANIAEHSIGYFGDSSKADGSLFSQRMGIFGAAITSLKNYARATAVESILVQFGNEEEIHIYDLGSGRTQDAVADVIQKLKAAGKNVSLDVSEMDGTSISKALYAKNNGNPNNIDRIFYLDLNGELKMNDDQKGKYHLVSYGVVLHQLPEEKQADAIKYAVEMAKVGGFISNPDTGQGVDKQAMLIPGNLADREGFVWNNNAKDRDVDLTKYAVNTRFHPKKGQMVKVPIPLVGLEKESASELGRNNGIYAFQYSQVIEFPLEKLNELNKLWNNGAENGFVDKVNSSKDQSFIKKKAYDLIKKETGIDLVAFQRNIAAKESISALEKAI